MDRSLSFRKRHGRPGLAFLATILAGLAFLFAGTATQRADDARPAPDLEIRHADHICIIGNTLAERMQHDGWLETLLQSRFPPLELVIRNLGFSGDELTVRPRVQGFGSPDQYLTSLKTDVIFAFFGYNESFAGPAGLDKFKKDLADFIKHSLGQQYNGKSAPRLVLFSPIAHEDLHDRNLPDGRENNKNLELYTAAMGQVAQANHVLFVDLFRPTLGLFGKSSQPLTINGVHLNDHGNQQLAQVIDQALFPALHPVLSPVGKGQSEGTGWQPLEKLRQAVLDKNFYWFNHYRTVDGYNIYGGRADMRYAEGISNREVMHREMEVLDVMAGNRDRRIWAVAGGGDIKLDDGNIPPFIPVKTNKPGPGPHGEHVFIDGQEAIKKMTVAPGMKVNLFASEKDFPEVANPVQMSFDGRGRLWVAVWPTYPHWKPKEEMNDQILILEDTKGTGKADKCTVFADHLHCPTGFEFYNGGILVAQAPDLMFLKDTTGNGKADLRVRVLDGLDSADTHHTANSFALDPGGALYFQEGLFNRTQVETPYGPVVRNPDAGVYRYELRTQKFEVYIPYGFANPHGHVFDHWGQDFVIDGTGANPFHAALISGHLENPHKHPAAPQLYQQRTRPSPGVEILSSRHFPEANQGNLLVANVIGFQGILQYHIEDRGSSFAGTEVEPILSSTDENFRPTDLKIGPDGAIYFLDWHNPIIGHLQHHLRDPSRDRTHGRIYRVTYEGRPLLPRVPIAGESIGTLLDCLKEPEDRVRARARTELGARNSAQVLAGVHKWTAALDPKDPQYEHNLLEALWVHQAQNDVNVDLLKRILGSPDFRARAAATRVLCYWRDRVPEALDLFKKLAADPHPRVRLEAVRAASFLTIPEAVEVALISADYPSDLYLDYTRAETMKALDPYVKKAIALGRSIAFTSPAGARFFLKTVSTDDLLKMKRTQPVYREMLFRKGVRDEYRHEALAGLAKLDNKSELQVLLDAIRWQDDPKNNEDESVVFDLVRLLTGRSAGELAGMRSDLERLATGSRLPVTRQIGFVALIAADGSVDKTWEMAMKSVSSLQDLVQAMPLIRDPGLRAALYPRVEPLLGGLPKPLASAAGNAKSVMGRYLRIELPGPRRTLTLAEIEVYSDGRNVGRQGKATQKNTDNNGIASKAIDGNTSGRYADASSTHTREGTADPWWEVDLGQECPIDSVVVYNRTDGNLGKRLEGFSLLVLDSKRTVTFRRDRLPAPAVKAVIEVGGESPERTIRRAAMAALTSVRGQEAQTFKALVPFVADDFDRSAAVRALQRIPASYWPLEEVRPVLSNLTAYLRKLPVQDRTSPTALDALQLGYALSATLPPDAARQVRKELGDLGVRVLRIGTLPEQMLYDKERLVVQAGKPVEVLFENNDLMPHNFVITQPGTLEEVGMLAESSATQPGAQERGYVPVSNKLLLASNLLQPRTSQKLSFTAPTQPGVYPYVCTYPGHWRRMFGALYVVADLDEYLADAEGYLAKHPVPIADELLKFNRPRKEWKVDDLASSVEPLEPGRSFDNGKHLFQVANCVACHRINGVGREFGPDLTQLDPKWKPADILRDVLEPSFRIEDKFTTYVFETDSGKVVTGLVLEETPEVVKIIENPLVKADPVILKKSQISQRTKSPTSMMPKGLLDKLTRDEILDLLAFVVSRGDPHSPLFQGGHDHAHMSLGKAGPGASGGR